jgi:hypothetical protein
MVTQQAQRFAALLKLADLRQLYKPNPDAPEDMIKVHDIVGKLARVYEKIRNTIDYREEHLLRKNAIRRILNRRLAIKMNANSDIGLSLIREITAAGYIEDGLLPARKSQEVNLVIEKYLSLFNFSGYQRFNREGKKIFKWLVGLAAVEIEQLIVPPVEHKAMVDFMYGMAINEVKIEDKKLDPRQKEIQVYLAVYRALIKVDADTVHHILLRRYLPTWLAASKEEIMATAKRLRNLKATIERDAKLPVAEKLLRALKHYAIAFLILRDVINANGHEILTNQAQLEAAVRRQCDIIYKQRAKKLRSSILRVTIYIFITKMLMALLLEFPYDLYIATEVRYLPLIINALFPPLLIFLVGIFIQLPRGANTNAIVGLIHGMIYQNKLSGDNRIRASVSYSFITTFIYHLLYTGLFVLSFGLILKCLSLLNFSVVSKIIFILFLSVVSFFVIRIRQGIRELFVTEVKESPLIFIINLLAFPYLKAGQWISMNVSKINVFVFLLDFIIEAPFKIFLEVAEDWIGFLKEKKEEVYGGQQE